MAKMITAIAQLGMGNEMRGTRIKGDANSAVTTYFITGEELEKYRAIPAPRDEKVKHSNSRIW